MKKSAHLRGQFAQFFFHLGGIKVGVSTFFTLGVNLKKFFTLGCTPPHPHPVPIYECNLAVQVVVSTLLEFVTLRIGNRKFNILKIYPRFHCIFVQ